MVIRRTPVLAVLLAAVLAAGGCARDAGTGDSAGAPAPTPSTAAPSAAAPSSPAQPPAPLPESGKPSAAGQTITGTVAAGVEPDCLLLTGNGTEHLLLFADPAMRADAPVGAKLTVTGEAQPGQMTTCQQGVPFLVTAVRPA